MSDNEYMLTDAQKLDLANILQCAWKRYSEGFGEAPHGTQKQMRALVEFMRLDGLVRGIVSRYIALEHLGDRP